MLLLFFCSASSSVNAATSSEPVATHQRLIIFNGFGEHINIMKMKTPCNAINTSKNANGDIVVASAGVVDSFMLDVIISIIMHIDIVTKRNAILWALIRIKSKKKTNW